MIFCEGDRVKAVRDIYQEPDEDQPFRVLASAGEQLIVVRGNAGENQGHWPVVVRHDGVSGGFGVQLNEIHKTGDPGKEMK